MKKITINTSSFEHTHSHTPTMDECRIWTFKLFSTKTREVNIFQFNDRYDRSIRFAKRDARMMGADTIFVLG